MSERIPTLIVGGTGYVAGELLRLVAGHPQLDLHGVSSETAAGTSVSAAFPHLSPVLKAEGFITQADLAARMTAPRMALFAAAPHAVSAGVIATLLEAAAARQCQLTVVDVSSDFRFKDAAAFQAVYKTPHGAPELLPLFTCALPEHVSGIPGPHVGHPGCFATSMLAGMVPMLKLGLCEAQIYATGITGSTGAGRTPTATTHHPERHSNLFAYNPLRHRHAPDHGDPIDAENFGGLVEEQIPFLCDGALQEPSGQILVGRIEGNLFGLAEPLDFCVIPTVELQRPNRLHDLGENRIIQVFP